MSDTSRHAGLDPASPNRLIMPNIVMPVNVIPDLIRDLIRHLTASASY